MPCHTLASFVHLGIPFSFATRDGQICHLHSPVTSGTLPLAMEAEHSYPSCLVALGSLTYYEFVKLYFNIIQVCCHHYILQEWIPQFNSALCDEVLEIHFRHCENIGINLSVWLCRSSNFSVYTDQRCWTNALWKQSYRDNSSSFLLCVWEEWKQRDPD